MFDSEWLKRFEYVWLASRRPGGRSMVAGPRRALPGGGTEVTGLRDYAPGDDYRYIDWTLCARRDELLTKTFSGDEDLSVYLLLDCSPSMGLGRPSKFDLARRVAAVLGCAVLRELGRLSVIGFSDGIVAQQPPIRGKARAPGLLRFLRQLGVQGAQTDLAATAERFVRRYQRHGPVVVISDLYDRHGFQRGLDVLRHRGYEPRVVQIYAAEEADPGLLGDVELYEVEAATSRSVTITERAARRYRELFAEFCESVRRYCVKHGLDCMQIVSDASENEVLLPLAASQHRASDCEAASGCYPAVR